MSQPLSYKINAEVPQSYMPKLFDYMYNQYVVPQKQRFTDITRETSSESDSLSYVIVDSQGKRLVKVEITSGEPIEIKVIPIDPSVSSEVLEEAKQDVIISTQIFRENYRKATVYFAWRQGEQVVPEAYKKPEKSFHRLFLETQVLFFVVFIIFGMAIFIGVIAFYPSWFWVAPLILIGVQFIFVFYSSKFIVRTADWKITKDNPIIHFLEFYLPASEEADFKKKYSQEQLWAIKKEIYDKILSERGEVDPEAAQQVFLKHGVPCELENLKTKKVNVYDLVKGIADRFRLPTPKIIVSNTMVPNAAASGPSPSRGLVLITTGLLVQLDEEEIRSVLGHEFGHLSGRDPLILYGLVSGEFLFRFYVLLAFFPIIFTTLLFFVYFWAVMVAIFFVAKFFEARADLVSALMIGTPLVLAGSLEKIGFQRLLYERTPSYRFQEWLGLDPHPPIYFRVDRLEKLTPEKMRHPLIQSIKDVTKGFVATWRS
ncbi:MAG TPA: M56 family metallopeptidase [Candidatus Limnocylindrales bacterium]|nr:M56 family metallopeptidase [Candidatus Limnocylindrales bacterium]